MNRDLINGAMRGRTGTVLRYAFLCALLAGLASVLLLALSGWFLTAAAMAGAAGAAAVAAFNYLIPSAAIRALAIVRTGARYGERLLSHKAALTAMADWRGTLFGKLAAQDTRSAPDLSGGDASARLIGDIEALEDLIVRRPTRPASLAAAVFGVALTLFAGWQAALVLAVLLAILPFLLKYAARHWTREPAKRAADALGNLRSAFVDAAAARPEIISYGIADRVSGELMAQADEVDKANAALFRGEGKVAGLLVGYGTLAAALVLILATSAAPLIALGLLAATSAVESMAAFARTAVRQASVEQGLERLSLLAGLTGDPARAERSHDAALPLTLGDAAIAPGERIAITGRSGSGKTQLIEALAGLRSPVHALAVGGAPVEKCDQQLLTGQFALAPQDAGLIAGTIADNLRLARPGVSEEAMHEALHVACLDERIAAMPDGLDTLLGESGGTLSGGERKRLSLARALIADRPWLVLDEPTEGLDAATESELIVRLKVWLDAKNRGLVLVSHRKPPLALADRMLPIGEVKPLAG